MKAMVLYLEQNYSENPKFLPPFELTNLMISISMS
jgi:hypothetical protein